MEQFVLNPGPLTGFNSLTYNLGPQLRKLREAFMSGSTPHIILDLRHLNPGHLNISAIAGLLSICRKVSLFTNNPLETYFTLNPYVQLYLKHIDFFKIARELDILIWDERTVGGFWSTNWNPNTKLVYFDDVVASDEIVSPEDLYKIKRFKKVNISPNLALRCEEIFQGIDSKLANTVLNTILELVTNSLIHAQDYAFLGIQRTSNRISVSVCDSGIGFKRSLAISYPEIDIFQTATNIQALVIASFIQEHEHGLRLAISEILKYDESLDFSTNDGWVVMSSYNSEVRWQKQNWDSALQFYENHKVRSTLPDIQQILGKETRYRMDYDEVVKGYWKNYKERLVGTRITFEIPLYK